ncbi:MAG: ABC transporter permease [Bdellovibrionales bacterium]|nr:ABC transporter permease [Bdellovibrionales bacterium]
MIFFINYLKDGLKFFKGFFSLVTLIFSELFKRPFYYQLMIKNMYDFGYRSLFIVTAFAVSTGYVVTLHIGLSLEKYGAKLYVSKIMIISLFAEISTVLIVFILAGKIGSGITSEVGSMKLTEQFDAFKALGISPVKRVIIPKVLACLIIIPILCIISSMISLLVSAYIGKLYLQLDYIDFLARALRTPKLGFVIFGFFKTMVFAFFIAITSCYYGLNVEKGSYEIGRATMRAIVVSFMLIICGDFVLTGFYYSFIHFGVENVRN